MLRWMEKKKIQKQSNKRLMICNNDHQRQPALDDTRTTIKILWKQCLSEGNDALVPSLPDPTIEDQIVGFHPKDQL